MRTDDRKAFCFEDQFVGLLGNAALAVWRDGDIRAYLDMRHAQDRFPDSGDGGYDLPRLRFDIKTSMMRTRPDPLGYNLAVRPRERHDGWVYGLGLVRKFTLDDLKESPQLDVHLIGWALDSDLPEHPNGVGALKGACCIQARNLTPFTPLMYETGRVVRFGVSEIKRAA